jgi:hypothetical protein
MDLMENNDQIFNQNLLNNEGQVKLWQNQIQWQNLVGFVTEDLNLNKNDNNEK